MTERRREIAPPELAALVEVAESPRSANWSLRAALTRYAQPQPMRVSRLLDAVRRTEFALAAHTDVLRAEGPALWAALDAGDTRIADVDASELVLGLLACAREIDGLGDLLVAWAVDRQGVRPDAEVDAVTDAVSARLDALGVAREERVPPPGVRRRG